MQRPRLVPAAFVLVFAVCVVLASARVPAGGVAGAGVQPACQFLVSPTRIELTTAAAEGTIQVDTQPGCEWTASAGVSWFQITSGAAGNGPGTISYSVSAMPPSVNPLRQGAIQVRWNTPTLGQNVLITQSLGSCSALFLPARGPTSSLTFGGAGGGGHLDVLAEPPFSGQWRVLSAPDWITFTYPALGVVGAGDGSAWYAVSPNPSTEPRVGTITFCNGSLEIRQSGRSLRPGRFVAGDFDDDGRADPAVFRPSEGRWYVLPSGQNYNPGASFSHQWGLPGDVPVPGDFDGDKKTDLAVYRATGFAGFTTSGAWFLRYSSDAYGYGTPTAYPWSSAPYHALENRALLADFSGDGKGDFVVYRPSTGRWHIQFTSVAAFADVDVGLLDAQWGLEGDIPVPADYDGDGRADLAVWRPQSGEWYLRFSASNYTTAAVHQWGLPGDVPQIADFDGDGRADLTVYRPSSGLWFIKSSSSGYDGASAAAYQWGLPGDVPLANDYDGDGLSDLAVWRPSSGMWFFRDSSANLNSWRAYQWGLPGDVPLGPR